MQPNKLKLVMIGPSGCGKTMLANFISESINFEEVSNSRPTQGVRIVEFELPDVTVNDRTTKIDIELWDCSGDHKFESCWPALRAGTQGVILVCSSNSGNTVERELELLYNYFVSQANLSAKQCVLFYNCNDDDQDLMDDLNLSPIFSKVSRLIVNMKSGRSRVKIDFLNFVSSVLHALNVSK